MYKVNISSHTDIGDRKETNQDSILSKNDIINGHNVGLYIVADGCGGLEYGEEISNLIVSYFSRVFKDELSKIIPQKNFSQDKLNEFLDKTLDDINDKAISFSKQVSGRVGSTVSLLLTVDNRYILKNVGDSRIYLKRRGQITQLTVDQSLVTEKLLSGEITKEEAKNFKKKNVLTMCVGAFEKLRVYSKSGKIKKGDVFLLCCDGLHNHVSTSQMIRIINDKRIPFENKAEALRNCITPGTASDNVSSVLCECGKKPKTLLWLAISVVIVLLLLLFFRNQIDAYISSLMSVVYTFDG